MRRWVRNDPASRAETGRTTVSKVNGDVKMSTKGRQAKAEAMTIESARAQGLLIEAIPLAAIDADYLVRDRLVQDEDELTSLMTSLSARGQQMPIEVTRLSDQPGRYGLISGWRRLAAMRKLSAETRDPRFGEIRALVIMPDSAQDAYVAMIEENEIRVNLSHYERARIALRAVHEGVFPDQRSALRGLYGATTRSKRSKIGTFMSLVNSFDGVLQHPTAISEKLGLSLAREILRDEKFAEKLSDKLRKAPLRTAPEEIRILTQAVLAAGPKPPAVPLVPPASPGRADPSARAPRHETVGGVSLRYNPEKARIDLAGEQVDEAFFADLLDWISRRSV